jgi:hypothetical protein
VGANFRYAATSPTRKNAARTSAPIPYKIVHPPTGVGAGAVGLGVVCASAAAGSHSRARVVAAVNAWRVGRTVGGF